MYLKGLMVDGGLAGWINSRCGVTSQDPVTPLDYIR